LIHKAISPPGEARLDWQIIQDLALRVEERLKRETSAGFDFIHPSQIWDEMAELTPPFQGISHERIRKESGVHWPCPSPDHPGTPYLFSESFPRGKGILTPLEYRPSQEMPDKDYPYILSTGRVLYHWHGGTMTRRSKLDDIYPEAVVEIHPDDAEDMDLNPGEWVKVSSRRGDIQVRSLITERSPRGTVFIPFHFAEAAANELTQDARDPEAKIPDYKVCAVAVEKLP
jgi:predicted molibdopterin-dependent oxidoreductase YjgC